MVAKWYMSQPHFEGSVRSPLTLSKMGVWSPLGLLKTQKTIAGVKTPCIEVFFIPSERSWSVDVQNGLAWAIWTSVAQVMGKRRAGSQPLPNVWRRSATWRWKALEESYNFGWDLTPIGGRNREIWAPKVSGVQPGTISRLLLGSPGKKNHLDVASMERRKVYYMGEGGGFPRVRAVVSQVNPRLPMACPNTKRM
jgi:hypothetical protein